MKLYTRSAQASFTLLTLLALNNVQAFPLVATVEFDGHRYVKISPVGGVSWEQARANAAKETIVLTNGTMLKGHLVSITSQAEQNFISANFLTSSWQQLWLGGYQFNVDNGADNNWAWVSGEEIGNINTDWRFNFLDFGQPADDANSFGNEDTLRMLINGGAGTPAGTLNDRWHDFPGADRNPAGFQGYIIEFDHFGDNFSSKTDIPVIVSGSQWRSNGVYETGWQTPEFDATDWAYARSPYPVPTPPVSLIDGTNAEFMWHDPFGTSSGLSGSTRAFFRLTFNVDQPINSRPLIAKAKISVDDDYDLFINGNSVFSNRDGGFAGVADAVDFSSSLQNGNNVIAIEAVDGGWNNPRDRTYERVLFDATIKSLADLLIISSPPQPQYDADIKRFHGITGGFVGQFANSCFPVDMVYGPDNKLYVAETDHPNYSGCDPTFVVGRFNGQTGALEDSEHLHQYEDGFFLNQNTGNEVGMFIHGPGGLAFGPDDDLYISDYEDSSIRRFQGPFASNPGEVIDKFIISGSGGLSGPQKIMFGPDQNIYVISGSQINGQILRYQGPEASSPGTFIDAFIPVGSNGLDTPSDFVFGRDKHLYVASFNSDQILRYQGPTENSPGVFIDTFINLGYRPTGIAFGANNDLYVSGGRISPNFFQGVRRYDGNTGEFIEEFASVQYPGKMIFSTIPQYIPPLGDLNNDGCVDREDLGIVFTEIRNHGSYNAVLDINDDNLVNIADARKLVTLFTNTGGAECN